MFSFVVLDENLQANSGAFANSCVNCALSEDQSGAFDILSCECDTGTEEGGSPLIIFTFVQLGTYISSCSLTSRTK